MTPLQKQASRSAEIVSLRYVVATQLAGEWLPRAVLKCQDAAEAEAYRWRRIYGRKATQLIQVWVTESDEPPVSAQLSQLTASKAIDVSPGSEAGFDAPPRCSAGRRKYDRANRRKWRAMATMHLSRRVMDLMTLYIMGEMALRVLTSLKPLAF